MLSYTCRICLCLTLISCAVDIDHNIMTTRFVSPETEGKTLKGHVQLAYGSTLKMALSEVYTDAAYGNQDNYIDSSSVITRSGSLGVHAGLGLLESLDIFYRVNHDSPNLIGLKWQLFGSSKNNISEGFKLALCGGYGTSKKSEGEHSVAYNGHNRNYNVDLNISVYDISLIPGYRFNKNIISYLNTYYSSYSSKSKLTSDNYPDLQVEGITKNFGALLGTQFNNLLDNTFLKGEVGIAKAEWKGRITKTIYPIGASFGVYW